MSKPGKKNQVNRRSFLKTQAAVVGAAALVGSSRSVFAAGDDKIRIAVIGCGGRGSGAGGDNLKGCEGKTEIVAVADAFENKAKGAANKWGVSPENTFWGLDAYKKAISTDIDMIITATPPGFRPYVYKAAIEAGKHVFMEKPCCVDAPGYKMLLEANKMADEKGLKVGVGLQRRHQSSYVNGIKQIHDGKYGDLICLQAYWNGGGIWWRGPQEGWTDMMAQVNNWYHFNWLSGDNICEQHVHNLDVCNWAKDAHPVEANGMGGSEIRRRMFPETEIFDHHFVEFTYPDGMKMYSQCRHAKGAFNRVSEYMFGSEGHGGPTSDGDEKDRGGVDFIHNSPYVQEHYALVEAIRNDTPYNEGHYGATSSFTAVLGRMATYSGKVIKWDEAVEKGKELAPGLDSFTWDTTPPVVKDPATGKFPYPVVGEYNPFG